LETNFLLSYSLLEIVVDEEKLSPESSLGFGSPMHFPHMIQIVRLNDLKKVNRNTIKYFSTLFWNTQDL